MAVQDAGAHFLRSAPLAALPTEAPPLPSDAGLALIAVLRGLLQLPASKGNGGARGEQSVRFSA